MFLRFGFLMPRLIPKTYISLSLMFLFLLLYYHTFFERLLQLLHLFEVAEKIVVGDERFCAKIAWVFVYFGQENWYLCKHIEKSLFILEAEICEWFVNFFLLVFGKKIGFKIKRIGDGAVFFPMIYESPIERTSISFVYKQSIR